ncbi:MAG: hypothetical protein J6Q31_07260 [Alistipes sp.]|nr:hypothetical protein [Alistipes sp.]MBO7195403.1 hypothetical protein [Alistipes sp.]
MENVDINLSSDLLADEERLLHSAVICDDAELFYIDCYLRELFSLESETTC